MSRKAKKKKKRPKLKVGDLLRYSTTTVAVVEELYEDRITVRCYSTDIDTAGAQLDFPRYQVKPKERIAEDEARLLRLAFPELMPTVAW